MSLVYPQGPIEQIVSVMPAGVLSITQTPSGGSWLGVAPVAGGINVYANVFAAASLPVGVYGGSVTLQSPNGGASVTISVTLTLTGYMAVSPSALTFNTANTAQQTLNVSGPISTTDFTVRKQASAGGNWLGVSPGGSLTYTGTPLQITVMVYAYYLPPGTYTGEIDLTPIMIIGNGVNATPQRVPVTLTVPATGNVSVTNSSGSAVSSLTFTAQAGGAISSPQPIVISSAAAGVSFSYSTSAPWLLANMLQSGRGSTPATLPVAVNPGSLSTGNYQGNISIMAGSGQTVSIPVTLTVSPAASVSATPANLALSYIAGSAPPQSQTIQVSGNGGTLPFSVTTTSAGNWLVVSPVSGTTSASGTIPLSVSFINLGDLKANQAYTSTIVVSGTAGASGSTTITVTISVTAPLPTIVKVTNAASFNSGDIAAGEILTIFGTALGPDQAVALTPGLIANNQLPTTMGGVQVLFSGFAAPLLYVSGVQVSAIVPYEIASPAFLVSPSLLVKHLGQSSNIVTLVQAGSAPGIFTANSTGSGPGAILNADLSVNSKDNPANPGDPVVLYVTGEGQTTPPGISGRITPVTAPFSQPILPPVVTIDGQPAQVIFYAEAPDIVGGVMQVNVQIPSSVPSGDLPVVVTIGGRSSQLTATGTGAVTVSVR